MGFVTIVKPSCNCPDRPAVRTASESREFGVGTIWECDHCKRHWIYTFHERAGYHWAWKFDNEKGSPA